MITRVRKLARLPLDFRSTYSGACFLVGGGYQLPEVKHKLDNPSIFTMAMNNAATQFTPNLWVGADSPDHYSPSIMLNPTIMKFLYMRYVDEHAIGGVPASSLPNTYFMARHDFEIKDFFTSRNAFGWWKNVHMLALEVLYYLGFRTVYMVSCGLSIDARGPYGYESDLAPAEIAFNKVTYAHVVADVRALHREAAIPPQKLDMISCTPDSKLNDFLPYVELDDAIQREAARVPPHQTAGFRRPSHSGLLGKPIG